jgi:hypothetical protein
MMDWTNNKPNPRFWVLKLIKDNLHAGDSLVETNLGGPESSDIEAQAYLTSGGHRLLLANKRDRTIEVKLPDAEKASALSVDESSADEPAHIVTPADGEIKLEPFAVAVVRWKS